MREDRFTTTPADAEAFERHHAPAPYDDDVPSMADVVGNDTRAPFPLAEYVDSVLERSEGGRRRVTAHSGPQGDYVSLALLDSEDADALVLLLQRWILDARVGVDGRTVYVRRAPAPPSPF